MCKRVKYGTYLIVNIFIYRKKI